MNDKDPFPSNRKERRIVIHALMERTGSVKAAAEACQLPEEVIQREIDGDEVLKARWRIPDGPLPDLDFPTPAQSMASDPQTDLDVAPPKPSETYLAIFKRAGYDDEVLKAAEAFHTVGSISLQDQWKMANGGVTAFLGRIGRTVDDLEKRLATVRQILADNKGEDGKALVNGTRKALVDEERMLLLAYTDLLRAGKENAAFIMENGLAIEAALQRVNAGHRKPKSQR